jgi:hypothetical protein
VSALINLQRAQQEWAPAPQRAKELLDAGVTDAKRGIGDLRAELPGSQPLTTTSPSWTMLTQAGVTRGAAAYCITAVIRSPQAGPRAGAGLMPASTRPACRGGGGRSSGAAFTLRGSGSPGGGMWLTPGISRIACMRDAGSADFELACNGFRLTGETLMSAR